MITRRAATRAAALTALSYSRILGANDRIGLGVIGIGTRGTYVMSLFQKNEDVEVRALCDIYGTRLDRALEKAPAAKTSNDRRELLQLKEVDAVLIASPDHWHKDHAVDAMNAGKDVYAEKPMCRTREEAPLMLRAARVTGRVCQIGLQQRSPSVAYVANDVVVYNGMLYASLGNKPAGSSPDVNPTGWGAVTCDYYFDSPNGCQAHGMDPYFGGHPAQPQGVWIKDNSTGLNPESVYFVSSAELSGVSRRVPMTKMSPTCTTLLGSGVTPMVPVAGSQEVIW
jgi:hypothetical protein